MGVIRKVLKIFAGALTMGAVFYMAGGAAAALGVPGVSATSAGATGFLSGLAYGLSSADSE